MSPALVNIAAALTCERVMLAKEPRPLKDLINKVSHLDFKIEVITINWAVGSKVPESYRIVARQSDGLTAGSIHLERLGPLVNDPDTVVFRSSIISVGYDVAGKGLGALLYTLAARLAYLKGGILTSSYNPSSEATLTWKRLESAGWVHQEDISIYDPKNPNQNSNIFLFNQDLLRSGFFNSLDILLRPS